MSSSTPPTPATTTATSPARQGKDIAFACSSPDNLDVYLVSPPSSPAKGKGKLRREEEAGGDFWGMSDEALRRDIAEMSDRELRREIEGIPTFGLLLTPEKRERRQRLWHLLEKEAQRRGIRYGRNQDVEDELMEDASRKYFPKSSSIHPMKNYGQLGVQTSTRPRKPIVVDKIYSSKTSPTALYGHTLRVRAVDQKENDNEKSRHNYRNYAKREYSLNPAMEERNSAKKGAKGSGEPKGCSSGSLPKNPRTARKTTSKCNPEHEEEEEICNVFTHEMDNLECDICYLPFESQVYSCKNGHAVCAGCCNNMERKCPSCNESIGDFRCRATEKILAGMTRPCRFKKHGCLETVRYPFDGCTYSGRLLYGHILDTHAPGATFLFGSIT